MKTFADLKKSSSSTINHLSSELEKMSTTKAFKTEDDRFWYPDVDKAGNGSAVIRFLPAPMGEDVPFVRIWSHSFQGPTGLWYIENSLGTINQPDPVGAMNKKLWATGDADNQTLVRQRKRRLTFISNIYIIKDPANPENEGKVKLFRYGAKIFEMITAKISPKFEDQDKCDPFHFYEGATLRIRIRNKANFRNYDDSSFDAPGPLFPKGTDEQYEAVWKAEHSLQAFVAPDQFKTWDQLKERLDKVLAEDGPSTKKASKPATKKVVEEDDPPFDVDEDEDINLEEMLKKASE